MQERRSEKVIGEKRWSRRRWESFYLQAEESMRGPLWSRGLGYVYKRQAFGIPGNFPAKILKFQKRITPKIRIF